MTGRTPLIDEDRFLDILEHEGGLLAATTQTADHDSVIPACPGLTVGKTACHVGSMCREVLAWIREDARPRTWQRLPTAGQPVEDYLRDGLRSLLGELATHNPTDPCATWHPTHQHYGFWRRRMAHETTIHRVDVQSAAGIEIDVVSPEVAIDGIDEVLHVWFTHRLATLGMSGTRPGTVAIRSGERTWLATVGPATPSARRARATALASADALVMADPMDLYLWLWGRRPVFDRAVIREGDLDVSAQLWALLRLATQ